MSESHPRQGVTDTPTNTDSKDASVCPTCGKECKSSHGVKIHHTREHGESIAGVESTCVNCGEVFRHVPAKNRTYCSRDCVAEDRDMSGESNPNYSGGNVVLSCEWCGSEYETNAADAKNSRFCSPECKGKAVMENRELKGETVECAYCGSGVYVEPAKLKNYDKHYCGTQCRVEHNAEIRSGENHPNWNPETTGPAFYSTARWRETRADAIERDNATCQACAKKRDLHVHHIIPISQGGARFDLENLVTLCMSCHKKWEGLYLRPDTRGER